MRTFMFLSAALLLLATCLLLARLFSADYPDAFRVATIGYVVFWLVIAAFNMWVGVTRAGYSAAEELPIFLLIFGVPAIIAIVLNWRFL
jgi:hypothetical protein